MSGLAKVDGMVIAIIALYVVVIMGIGWWSSRRVTNMTDFLVAGRKLPMWMASATLLATWFGAGSSMGVAGTVYSSGTYGVVADPFGAALSLIIAGVFYVTHLRRMRLLTVTDIVEQSFGRAAGAYASFWMIPVYIGWLGVQIMGIGKILNLLFGVDVLLSSLIAAAIILAYTYAGGMWAVTLTDVVQVCLIIFGLSLILPGAIGNAGGIDHLLKEIPAEDLSLLPPDRSYNSVVSYAGQWIVMGLGCIVGQDLIQRSLASKTPQIAGRSAVFGGFAYLAICIIPITIGFCGRYVNFDPAFMDGNVLKDPEQVIPLMAVKVLPSWLLAFFLSALVSAIMSSADSSLLAASSLISNNMIKPYAKNLSEQRLLLLTRVFTVIVLILALFLALNVKRMFSLLVNSWASQLLVIFIPVTAALYWKRVGRIAAWMGMIAGPAVWIIYTAVMTIHNKLGIEDIEDDTLYQGAVYGFIAALILTAAGAWLFPRKADEPVIDKTGGHDNTDHLPAEVLADGKELPPPPILG